MLQPRNPAPGRGLRRQARRATAGGATLIAGAALAGSITPMANAAAPAPRTKAPVLEWAPCKVKPSPPAPGAECATLQVPVDWDEPGGRKFGLAVARRTATGPDTRTGTLVFGPGGPGDSGVSRVVQGMSRFSPEVRRGFDIVSFDPRGVGASNPVVCSSALLGERPTPLMSGQADFDATIAYNRRLRDDCRARTPNGLYDHVDTLSMVKDLEALRVALGQSRLNYHGSSYGTLLGQQYAEAYPKRIRAMVLESLVDHSVPTARRFLDDQSASAQDSFDQFVKWCERTEDCELHGQDVRAVWRGLIVRAERGELVDPDAPGRPVDPFAMLNREVFPDLYGPDYKTIAAYIARLAKPGPASRTRQAEPQTPTGADPLAAVFCSDWSLPVRDHREYAALTRRMREKAPDMPYARPFAAVAMCLGAPQPVSNPQHRLKVRNSPTILLTNALHDPASSYPWATRVAQQLGRQGVLLTYAGAGHGSTFRGPCMIDAVDRYLRTLETPPRGTRCPAVES